MSTTAIFALVSTVDSGLVVRATIVTAVLVVHDGRWYIAVLIPATIAVLIPATIDDNRRPLANNLSAFVRGLLLDRFLDDDSRFHAGLDDDRLG
jgi:hypothetical protein